MRYCKKEVNSHQNIDDCIELVDFFQIGLRIAVVIFYTLSEIFGRRYNKDENYEKNNQRQNLFGYKPVIRCKFKKAVTGI